MESGNIEKCYKTVIIGSNAKRKIIDYKLDYTSVQLIKQLAYNKLKKRSLKRNETIILSLLEKYCISKNINFIFQYELDDFRYDCLVANKLIIEVDEQHHTEVKQRKIYTKKDSIAIKNGFMIEGFDMSNDIIDIILASESLRSSQRAQTLV